MTELSFEELVEKASAHFCPKPSPIVKRYEFNTRVQGEGESIAQYVAALRKLAEYQYGGVLDDMLRDRLVCGISHKGIQRRLLQDPALTFGEAAMKVALSAEAADRDAQRLTAGTAADKDLLTEPSQGTQPPFVHKLDRP